YELADGADREATLQRLQRDQRVESAQPLHSFRTLMKPSSEPYRPLQRNLDLLNVSEAHRWSRGEGVRIGIVDTGVDISHPDLDGRIADHRDFVSASERGMVAERSEEHTSELQSRENLVCRLLLEKKKTKQTTR